MLEDFKTCKTGEFAGFDADICIVGAGAAGIILARALIKTGRQILLLESGGLDFEPQTQKLAEGINAGLEYYDLEDSRLRFFGGTTAIWGGRCAQMDDIDFQKRAWVPHSGWPITKEALRPYYRDAQAALDLPQIDDNTCPGFENPLPRGALETAFWQFDETFDRFTLSRCGDLVKAGNIKILLHANVINILCNETGTAVTGLEVANTNGGRGRVHARNYVLAAGGMENVRLLLSSRPKAHPDGIGNNHDQLGRYFMEHPHARGARIQTADPARLFRVLPRFLRRQGNRYGLLMRPSDAFQTREEILNTGFSLAIRKHEGERQIFYKSLYNTLRHELSPTATGRAVWKWTRKASAYAQDRFGPAFMARKLKNPGYGIYASIRAEQSPNPDSRIRLTQETDFLGVPKIKLDWRLCDLDKRSVRAAMQALDLELKALQLGSAELANWLETDDIWMFDPLISNHPIAGYHHMGGARMSLNQQHGVVDPDSRIHGMENIYIAGSSVFPTCGWANPTLTTAALALRLADFLKNG